MTVWSCQVSLYYYLVYDPQALSWDVMEPVTYFTLETATVAWWLYFIASSKETSLSELREGWVSRACTTQYVRHGFDAEERKYTSIPNFPEYVF